jgi:hypothetical protein
VGSIGHHDFMPQILTDLIPRGFLPIGLSADQNSVLFAPIADLASSEACFPEPRFDYAVAAYGGGERFAAPIVQFAEWMGQLDVTPPARVIAHTSRCGSTLLANLLALRGHNLVLKEPGFLINAIARVIWAKESGDRHVAVELVRGLVRYASAVAQAHSRQLVVKLTSWTTPVVAQILAPGSQDHWLLLWREPVEVVASLMAMPPSWWNNTQGRADVLAVLGSQGLQVPTTNSVEAFAHVWHAAVAPFVSSSANPLATKLSVLDYAALGHDPPAAFAAVEEWLALQTSRALPDGFTQVKMHYSKALEPVLFDPSGTHYRPTLNEQERATVRRVTGELLRQLHEITGGLRLTR